MQRNIPHIYDPDKSYIYKGTKFEKQANCSFEFTVFLAKKPVKNNSAILLRFRFKIKIERTDEN